nr:MAG TPA: hypothetical protein [Caudoviricetes sp.]
MFPSVCGCQLLSKRVQLSLPALPRSRKDETKKQTINRKEF